MIAFQCPQCGASMKFDPETQIMTCEYCGSSMDLEKYNESLHEKGQFIATEYTCSQCGGVIMATDATAATFCSYCGSPVALTGNMVEKKAPKKIIPFKFNKKQALFQYELKVKKSFFAPDWMLDPEAEQKFRGIYMPYNRHSFRGEGFYSGQAISTYYSGGYDYTDTFQLDTPVTASFSNIVYDASVAFPDTMSYNLGKPNPAKEVSFQLPYLSGFYADVSDVRDENMLSLAAGMATQKLLKEGNSTVDLRGHKANVNLGPAFAEMAQKGLTADTETVMNPVWFMSNRRGNKISYAAVDAVDGDVAVDIPIDFKKYLLTAVLVCGLISAVFNLLNFVPSPESVLTFSALLAIAGWIISSREYGKLWRRQNGYDNLGAMDEDTFLKVQQNFTKPLKHLANKAEKAKTRVFGGNKSGCLVVLIIIVCIPVFPVICGLALFLLPFYVMYAIIAGLTGQNALRKNGELKDKKFKPPFFKRLLRALPFILIIVLSFSFQDMYAENDTLQYLLAFAGIGVNVLMYFTLVRTQNKFAMRDIPVFTQKRGGDM